MGSTLGAKLEVVPEYKVVLAGEQVRYNVKFENLVKGETLDASVQVSAVNKETGKTVAVKTSTYAIRTGLSISESLSIPKDAPVGTYELRLEISYNGKTSRATDTFRVTELPGRVIDNYVQNWLGYVVIAIVLVLAFFLLRELKNVLVLEKRMRRY